MRTHSRVIAFLLAALPLAAGAQPLFETDFDDLAGWTPGWAGDDWRISRGQVQPITDSTCADEGDVDCNFGAPAEAVDNTLTAGDPNWTDYRVTARFVNYDDDAVGFVFRHQDADNYYLFLTSRGTWPTATRPSRDEAGTTARLYRVQNGRAALLASADVSYTSQVEHLVRIDALRDEIAVYLDLDGDGLLPTSERVFFVTDESPIRRGRVGLWAYDNRNVFVDFLRVFPIVPPPRPENLRVTSIDRAGEVSRFAFDLDTAATGHVLLAEGRCAEVDPAQRLPDAGVGTRILGAISTKPDTDYCFTACSTNANGTVCGPASDFSTRGATIDAARLSPGHWDLVTADESELLRTRATGAVHTTTARMGDYTLFVHGRRLNFRVDQTASVVLTGGDLDGRATVAAGRLALRGLPLTIDPSRQPGDTRWAVFGADFEVGLGAYEGRAPRSFEVLPGRYVVRTRGVDSAFEIAGDGTITADAGAALEVAGSTVRPTPRDDGEAVAFRVRVTNEGPNALRGAGLFNGRAAEPGDETGVVFAGLTEYVRADATRALFGNLATSLGHQPGPYAFYGFDRLAPGDSANVDVLVFPSNPRLSFVGDVSGTLDRFVIGAAPYTATLFDAAGEPTSGELGLIELDVDGGSEGALRRRYSAETGRAYGRITWSVLARSATPGPLTVHSMNAEGTKVRVAFTSNRPGLGSVQYVDGGCEDADWSAARELGMGEGADFFGDLVTSADKVYCARGRVRNAAGARTGPHISFATTQGTIDATGLRGKFRVQRPGPNLAQVLDAGRTYDDLGLRMGDYLVDQGGSPLEFTIDKDGRIAYDAALEGVLGGADTPNLILNGVAVDIDARALTGDATLSAGIGNVSDLPLGAVRGGRQVAIKVLPGNYGFEHGERHAFVVGADGAVVSAAPAALEGGANRLVARGRAVNFDLLPLAGDASLAAAKGQPTHTTMQGAGVREVLLLPGRYVLAIDGTRSILRIGDAVEPTFDAIEDRLPIRSCAGEGPQVTAEGVGTDTFVMRAAPCAITADIVCEDECGEGPNVFQLSTGRGTASGTVRYASGQPVRADEMYEVTFEVDGGAVAPGRAVTDSGVAEVAYTAANRRGDYLLRVTSGDLTATRAFVVVPIRDFSPPRIVLGADVTVEQSNADGAPLRLDAPAVTDNVDPAPRITSDAPAVFPLGRTVVTWRAVDFNGNAAFANQVVTVVDTTAPVVDAPARIELEATSPAGTSIDETQASASDICDARPDLTRDGPRGFPVGETMITWTATDDSGNTATAMTTVAIVDTTPPRIVFDREEIVIEATNANGATGFDLPLPVVTDNGDPNPTVEHNVRGGLPKGRTLVTFTATDASGNRSEARIAVRVVDGTPPRIDVVGAPEGWVRRADFLVSVFDVSDPEPVLNVTPAPDGELDTVDGLEVTYFTGGQYDVALSAVDDEGNQARRILRTFGVDPDAPRLRLSTSLPDGANAENPGTWPVVFSRERIRLSVDVADAPANGVSGVASLRIVLDPDGADPMVLAEVAPAPAGAPLPAGPASLRGVRCDDALLCTADGDLIASRAGAGAHVIAIEATDVAGNTVSTRRYFRVFTLQAALLEGRLQVLDLADADGVANEGVDALLQAAAALQAAADLAPGQPAGIDAPLDLTGGVLRKLQRAAPALRRAERFGVEVGPVTELVGRAIFWAVAGFGQVGLEPDIGDADDYARAIEVFMPDAQQQLDLGNLEQALASLVDAYFLFDNGLRPQRVGTFDEAADTAGAVAAQVRAYLDDPARPGVDVLAGLADDLDAVAADVADYAAAVAGAETDEELILALGDVPAEDYLATLLQLQAASRAMQSAGQDDVWIRNWGWGLIQTVMFLSDKAFQRSAFILVNAMHPEANTLVPRAEAKVEEGQDLVADRQVDRFIQLFLARDTECVIVLMYRAAFDDAYAVPAYCEE